MNDDLMKNFTIDLNLEDAEVAKRLIGIAQQTDINPLFRDELEKQLKDLHKSKKGAPAFTLKKLVPAFLWAVAFLVLVIVMDWAIRSLAPPQPAAGNTPKPTLSEGATPTTQPPFDYTVQANDTCAYIADKFGISVESIAILNDLPANCPLVYTGQVLKIPYPTPTPGRPLPEVRKEATPSPSSQGYNWHGTTLYLAQPLPALPAEAKVYLLQPGQHATLEDARALAQRFGIQGEIYQSPGNADYVVTDGKQWLSVSSDQYFTYYADYRQAFVGSSATVNTPDALAAIDRFLKSHGFDFAYAVDYPNMWDGYYIMPLTPDGFPVHHEFFKPSGLLITLDDTGQVESVQANLINYQLAGTYGIRSAEQAFQTLLDPNAVTGFIEGMHSASQPIQSWQRVYPENQSVTIYGRVSSIRAVDPGKPPFVQIDVYTATGNLAGLDRLPQNSYIEATGKFVTENGIEKFNVESWKVSGANEDGLLGTLQRDSGGQVILSAQEGDFVLPDVPADVPMPFEKAYVIGTKVGSTFEWKSIDDRMAQGSGGGGGGGGGLGFYKLNLSGTPVPVIRPTAPVGPAQSLVGQRIEDQRGLLSITIYNQPDGSQQPEYNFSVKSGDGPIPYMVLEGRDLQSLMAYQNRPVNIWGTVDRYDQNGTPVVKVDRYEIPFPDLKFQIIAGTQTSTGVQGQPAILFTAEDGKTYVQLTSNGDLDNAGLIGQQGDKVILEALIVPDETFGGYPTLRIFAASMAISPKSGQPIEMTITADQVYAMDKPPTESGTPSYTPPSATIEKVELVYFISDPSNTSPDTKVGQPYLQPVWRFYGHYSNGDEFEVLVQALKDEFLLPELAPYIRPG